MATLFTKYAKQTATYWGAPVNDGYGKYTFAAPVTIQVRWTVEQKLFIDPNGKEVASIASVGSLDRDLDIGGYLYLGTSIETDPTSVSGAYEIRGYKKIPNFKATDFYRKVYL